MQFAGKRGIRSKTLFALGFRSLPCEETGVELWQTRLRVAQTREKQLAATLSPDEQQRAARFRTADDRRRFVVARGMLRQLLGHYLAVEPETIEFSYGPHGKPRLKRTVRLQFNLSHAGERAVYAVAVRRPVGIDIERIARNVEFERVARRFFSPNEFAELMRQPPQRRQNAFYRLWTAKEAVIKTTGKGLAQSLKQFEIDLTDSAAPRILQLDGKHRMKMKLYRPHAGRAYMVTFAISGIEHPADR